MKKSKNRALPPPFLNIRVRLRSSGDTLTVKLPTSWCVDHGLGESTEIQMFVFQDMVLLFPMDNNKPSMFANRFLGATVMMELWERLKDAEQTTKGHNRPLTRDKRRR